MSGVCLVRTWKRVQVGPPDDVDEDALSYLPKVFGAQGGAGIPGEFCGLPKEVTVHARFATCARCLWFYEKEMGGAQGSASAARLAQVRP